MADKVMREEKIDRKELFEKARILVEKGMKIGKACEQVGLSASLYSHYKKSEATSAPALVPIEPMAARQNFRAIVFQGSMQDVLAAVRSFE